MIRLLLIVLFIASIVMSNQVMAVVDDTPVFVNGGTLAISSIPATSGTASVSVTNFPATQNVNVIGVVTTTGTNAISGIVTTVGTNAVSNFPSVQTVAGTVTVANPQTAVSITGVVTTAGTQSISNFPSVQVTSGTQAISNFPSVQVVAGTMALSTNASTATNQASIISQLGTIGNALVNGTISVNLGSRFTSQTFAAASQGTLSLSLGKGISEITIDSYDPDACSGYTCPATDKKFLFLGSLDGVNFRAISCSDGYLLDEQVPIDSITGDGTNNGTGYFRCPVSGIETFRMIASIATKRATLNIAASAGNTMIQQVQAIGLTKQYDWPNGSANTANSKSIIPATDSANFPVMVNGGTIACSNCSGASSGTTAISGTVPVSVIGVATVNGTIVQGAGGSSAWLTTSTLGTLTKVATVDTITNPVTVNTHAVTQSGTWTVGMTGGTVGISGPVNTFGTMSITGGTVGIAGTVPISGSLAITNGTLSASQLGTWTVQPGNTQNTTPWLTTSTTGTLYANQLGTWSVNVTNGTVSLSNSISGQNGVAGGGGTISANTQRYVPGLASTYMAATQPWTPGATPTALLKFQGSQTTTAKLKYLDISCTQTTAGINNFFLIKRSTATIGGTLVTATAVPLDSNSPSATAVFGYYTANNAGTLGAVVGTMGVASILCPAPGGTANDRYRFDFTSSVFEPAVVRGTTQMYELNFNGAALPSGLSIKAQAVWTEE